LRWRNPTTNGIFEQQIDRQTHNRRKVGDYLVASKSATYFLRVLCETVVSRRIAVQVIVICAATYDRSIRTSSSLNRPA
jgi:hypothetical protein